MSSFAERIEKALRSVLENAAWTGEFDSLWGNESGAWIVPDPRYPREVYYHNLPGQAREVGIAILDSDSGLLYRESAEFATNPPRITIGYPPRSRLLHVKGIAKTLEAAQAQGALSQIEQVLAQLGTSHGQVSASLLGGMNVHVSGFWYDDAFYDGDALETSTGLPTLHDFSVSGYTAATSSYSQWVIVYFDPADASIGLSANAETFGTPSQLAESAIDLSAVPAGCYVLGAVGLGYGQTVIDTTSRIADPRFHIDAKEDPRLRDPDTMMEDWLSAELAEGAKLTRLTGMGVSGGRPKSAVVRALLKWPYGARR